MLTGVRAKENPTAFEYFSVTDCKSLFDAVKQMTPSLSEKRTVLDLTSVRESLAKDHLIWVPTWAMVADGLTKTDWELMTFLTKFMSHTWIDLKGRESQT